MAEANKARGAAGVVAVAATYVFFLLYAQFGFLRLLRLRLAAAELEPVMVAMGLAGLAASLATGAALARVGARRLLRAGFLGCAATATAALGCTTPGTFVLAAALIGACTGTLTVALAASLRSWVGAHRFGLRVGLGTGLAYLVCNLPPIFGGSPVVHSAVAAAACLAGFAALRRRGLPAVPQRTAGEDAIRPRDYRGLGFASVILSFLALIWLDSAAFAIIQETAALKGQTWGGAGQKLLLGGTHFLAAVAAGRLLDRGGFRSLLLAAFALFAVAFPLLQEGGGAAVWAGPMYAVGISFYSVALVVYPSWRGDGAGLVPRRWRAALLYGVAGWLGSALGVGMAQSLHRIPMWFSGAAALLLMSGQVLTSRRLAGLVRTHATTLTCGVAALVLYASPPAARQVDGDAAARGRRVYVQEGCIHCHSQYVRPASRDTDLWGPHRGIDRQDSPPLLGNRRQGPDLTNAGSRRSAVWHKLHLLDPRSLAPSSRMPAYAHLFADGSTRGDDLVAYLASLGEGTEEAWLEHTSTAPMGDAVADGSPRRGRELFGAGCAPCHGAAGRGDGPLAAAVYRPAMNLRKGAWWLVSWGPGAEPEERALARLVKYGVPGTSMPGHEYMTQRQLADVVAFVRQLAAPRVAALGGPEAVRSPRVLAP